MLRNTLFVAMCVFCLAVFALVCAVGGCGGARKNAAAVCPVPEPEKTVSAVSIGNDAASVGRLEQPASVTATVYHADGGRDDGQRVDLTPGTWLVPSRVFVTPDETGSGAADEN